MIRVCRLVGATWTDISDYVIGVSGLQRKFNYDRSPVIPAPEFELHGVELFRGDLLDVSLDNRSIFRLEVAETPSYDYGDGVWRVKTLDLLNRLSKRYVREIVTSGPQCWWLGWVNPDITDYRYTGVYNGWDEDFLRITFLLKVMVRHLTGLPLDTSAIDNLDSGFVFRHEAGNDHVIPYSKLYLQYHQLLQIGVTEPGKLFYETATWLETISALLSILRLYLAYDDGQYRLYLPENTQDVDPDRVYDYNLSDSEVFDFVKMKSAYVPLNAIYGVANGGVEWTDDCPVQVSVVDLDSATYSTYVAQGRVNAKSLSTPANLVLYRLRNYTTALTEIPCDDTGVLRPGAVDWMTQLARLRAPDYEVAHNVEEIDTDLTLYDPTQFASYTFNLRDPGLRIQRVVTA
jgi:hypothetical protein